MSKEVFQLVFGNQEDIDVYERWLDLVANRGIKREYYNVVQTGGKEGIRYATHIIDVVSLAAALRPLIAMSELEQRIVFTALSVHDLNKSPNQNGKKRFADLATEAVVSNEIEFVGFDEFFSDWRENITAITRLVAAHAGKFHVGFASGIPKAKQPENITSERLRELEQLVTAVDEIAVARSFIDSSKIEKGVTTLNTILPKEYELAWHRLSEQRGLFSNIIHREAALYLQKQGWHTLVLYPEGTYYLKVKNDKFAEDAVTTIARNVQKRLRDFNVQKFDDFIQPRPLGITIDAQVLGMGVSPSKIWEKVSAIIESRQRRDGFKISTPQKDGQEDKCRERLKEIADENGHQYQKIAQEWLIQPSLFPQTQTGMALGELLRTYYIFLESHYKYTLKSQGYKQTWNYLYSLLSISEDEQERFEPLDKRQDRAYLVAKFHANGYDKLLELIEEDSAKFLIADTAEKEELSPIGEYVLENLSLSHLSKDKNALASYLQRYVTDSFTACAYGSTRNATREWMSVDVSEGIKVQQFSNRLPAGKRDPKRNVSPEVQAQFQLENMGFASAKNKALYLHCMPYTFLTEPFLKALRQSLKNALDQGITAGMLQVDEVLENLNTNKTFDIILKPTKGNGLPIPTFSELIGNIITLPLNSLGNDSERYLEAIPYTFLLSRFFGVKVLLTESAIPMHDKDDFGEIYLDGIPALFRGLFRVGNLSPNSEGIIPEWEIYQALRTVSRQLYVSGTSRNALVELISSYLGGELHVFHVADRLIEAKTRSSKNSDAATLRLSQQILPLLEQVNQLGGIRDSFRSS
jgi:CRISPR-associated protein Csc3